MAAFSGPKVKLTNDALCLSCCLSGFGVTQENKKDLRAKSLTLKGRTAFVLSFFLSFCKQILFLSDMSFQFLNSDICRLFSQLNVPFFL